MTPIAPKNRPRFSVMLPVYEPGPFLLETLASVLAQDPGPERMEIVVVDDASPRTDVAALVGSAKLQSRVVVQRNAQNLGLAGNWNACIDQARGELIHLLHQDDLVLPGFYERLSSGFERDPRIGMAFTRYRFIDEQGTETQRSDLERKQPGVIRHWLARITERNRLQCPAIMVKREVYEALGGFRSDLQYALDWEMWVRIAASRPVWFEPAMLASYRRHPNNESARLDAQKATHRDELHAMELFAAHLPIAQGAGLMQRAYARFARSRLRRAKKRVKAAQWPQAEYQLESARVALDRMPSGLQRWLYQARVARIESKVRAKRPSP
jgi:glycosyltransferase involved in cell wall biosynthesis